ncbi:MAG: hypothetical protein ACXVH3_38415 [Solirubrobacteraceae bacterium]
MSRGDYAISRRSSRRLQQEQQRHDDRDGYDGDHHAHERSVLEPRESTSEIVRG